MKWLLVGRWPIARDAHHVIVNFRERLALVDVPEALRIGGDAGIYDRLPIDGSRNPSRRDLHTSGFRKLLDVFALDDFGAEGCAVDDLAVGAGCLDGVGVLRIIDELHAEVGLRNAKLPLE